MLLMDGPSHLALRHIVALAIRRDAPAPVRDPSRSVVTDLLSRHRPGERLDLLGDLIEPIVGATIFPLITPDRDLWPLVAGAGAAMMGLLDDLAAAETGMSGVSLTTALTLRRRAIERPSALSEEAARAVAAGTIDRAAALYLPIVLLHGGYENPVNGLGAAFRWFLEHPDQVERCRSDTQARTVYAEALLANPPVLELRRFARTACTIGGRRLPEGSEVRLMLEEALAEGAGRRPGSPSAAASLAFGYGRHRCPGRALALAQGSLFLQVLAELPRGDLGAVPFAWRRQSYTQGLDTTREQHPC